MKMPAAGEEEAVQEIIYGTGNSAKIAYMKRALKDIPLLITGLSEAAEKEGILLPQIAETGTTVLENARLKAECYFRLFQRPVFSCDSGLYLWDLDSGMPLSKKEQKAAGRRHAGTGGGTAYRRTAPGTSYQPCEKTPRTHRGKIPKCNLPDMG